MAIPSINEDVAGKFEEVAALLEDQGANPFRVDAYRRGAQVLRHLQNPLPELSAQGGVARLDALPAIGPVLARAIIEYLDTGRLRMLDRLRGTGDPEALLGSVPGVGRVFARRLHRDLGIESLEDLEEAAYDGRLESLPRFGKKRLEGIRAALTLRLRARSKLPSWAPPIAEMLSVDREYRQRVAAGTLRKIRPRRFNPDGAAWLPVMHTRRGEHEYTALFSNTARAHEFGRTRDWVVLYYDHQDGREGQSTVVTAERGPLRGRRVVRGQEAECLLHYEGGATRPNAE